MDRAGGSTHDTLDRLGVLATSSLIELDRRGGPTRYRLLETVRHYAHDRLTDAGEATTRRQAHAEHFRTRALDHPLHIVDLQPWGLAEHIDEDDRNQLSALDWFDRHGELTHLGRLAARLPTVLGSGSFVDTAGRHLGRDDVAAALKDPAERALYLTASAMNASYLGRFRAQLTLGEAALFGEAAIAASSDPAPSSAATSFSNPAPRPIGTLTRWAASASNRPAPATARPKRTSPRSSASCSNCCKARVSDQPRPRRAAPS